MKKMRQKQKEQYAKAETKTDRKNNSNKETHKQRWIERSTIKVETEIERAKESN